MVVWQMENGNRVVWKKGKNIRESVPTEIETS